MAARYLTEMLSPQALAAQQAAYGRAYRNPGATEVDALGPDERDFITSAVISGVTSRTIMTRHVLRNVAGTIAVQGTYALSVAILVEGGLSFLGYGVQPPGSSLGLLVQEGTVYMVTAPWLIIAPGAVLVIAILAINLIGDALRDRFDPREARRLT